MVKDRTARERQRRFRRKWRTAAYTKLCGDDIQCMRCGIDDLRVLQTDHINAGGKQDVRENHRGSYMSLVMHIANLSIEEARKEYQVLCANCNIIKRFEKKEDGESVWDRP